MAGHEDIDVTRKTAFLWLTGLVMTAAMGPFSSSAEGLDGAGSAAPAGSPQNDQYVGTYEQFDTPMGSSISVLMVNGDKIKIASVDDTQYVNIPLRTEYQNRTLKTPIPEIRLLGTYRVNGNSKTDAYTGGEIFIVRKMEYLGGGEGVVNERERRFLPDFFTIDADAAGPLTLSELQIRFPDSLKPYFSDDALACFYRQVERRAADLGNPETMQPIRRVLLFNTKQQWEQSSIAERRLQLARYVTSMALGDC